MLEALQEFVGLLRRNGVRASTAETLDAARALTLLGLEDPGAVEAALIATLVKRQGDQATFDELFDLFFRRRLDVRHVDGAGAEAVPPLVEALRAQGFADDEIERLLAEIATSAAQLSLPARMALGIRRADLGLLFRLSGLRLDLLGLASPLQVGFVTQRVLADAGVLTAEAEARALAGRLAKPLGAERAAALARALEESLRRLRSLVRGAVEAEVGRRERRLAEDQRSALLADRPFAQLSDAELRALRVEVERLARKLKQRIRIRRGPARRGRLDLRRTARLALQTGGVPARLVYRRRPPRKPDLVLLVDISDSMRTVARFMLELVYTLQERFHRVRSFAFVSDLGDLTDLFRRAHIGEAIARAYAGAVVDVHANSNCGRALQIFRERHLELVGPRTTVLIIGDARNNYFPANAAALADVRARARRLLWLNPEPPSQWSFGDSVMRDYAPHCDRVEVVYNLAGLREVVERL